MLSIVVVTGSRSLVSRAYAHEWCVNLLAAAFREADILVTGDADGPDTWATVFAVAQRMLWRRWHLNGLIQGTGEPKRWCTHEEMQEARNRLGKRFPLFRDEKMVKGVAAHVETYGSNAKLLAFVDPASPTGGTQYTARCAADTKRIEVIEHRWEGVTKV